MVGTDRTISFNSVRYSTPPGYTGSRVWCRVVGDELSITARTPSGDLSEVWRHQLSTPGIPQIIASMPTQVNEPLMLAPPCSASAWRNRSRRGR